MLSGAQACCLLQGSEAHDQLLGQVFGYAAIIRSGLHIDQATAVTCAEGLTLIANKKSFLRELAANVLLELTGVIMTFHAVIVAECTKCISS